MMLSDVRDYVESLGISENVYMGKLPDKPEKSIGVYNSKHQRAYHTAIGGPHLEGYGEKPVTILRLQSTRNRPMLRADAEKRGGPVYPRCDNEGNM